VGGRTLILLDTHALVWWKQGRGLSRKAARSIEDAATVFVSPVSCWEVAMLVELGRVTVDRQVGVWVDDLLAQRGIEVAALTPSAAVAAASLRGSGFHGDPADCLLYATARELRVPIVTKDRRIRDHARRVGDLRCVW
jgi:PIN domain nuclease of toxin-antitoxin system